MERAGGKAVTDLRALPWVAKEREREGGEPFTAPLSPFATGVAAISRHISRLEITRSAIGGCGLPFTYSYSAR